MAKCHRDDPSVHSWWERDARGIELCKVCDECIVEQLKRYSPNVLTDEQRELIGAPAPDRSYEEQVEEPIEPEE